MKAMLVLDKMPENCMDCPLSDGLVEPTERIWCVPLSDQEEATVEIDYLKRREDCPLINYEGGIEMFEAEKKIKIDLIPSTNGNRPAYTMNPEYITVHDTGNKNIGANAYMHSRYVKNPRTRASWHFTVDDENIYQHLPTNENGWHAGDGRNGTGNRKSIGVEIYMNSDIDRAKAEKLAAELIAYLMWKFDIPIRKVVQHHHWTSGKNCPIVIRSRKNGWQNFINLIQESGAGESVTEEEHWGDKYIQRLKELGLISGDHKGTDELTWAEFGKVIVGLLDIVEVDEKSLKIHSD